MSKSGMWQSVLSRTETRRNQAPKELVRDFHATQYGSVGYSAATQWKSGSIL